MRTLALLAAAALAATPAAAETYRCRSDKGVELGVEVTDGRLAMHGAGRKVTVLCGRGAAGRCTRSGDGGWNYAGALGMAQFAPGDGVFGSAPVFRLQRPGEGAWTTHVCRAAAIGAGGRKGLRAGRRG